MSITDSEKTRRRALLQTHYDVENGHDMNGIQEPIQLKTRCGGFSFGRNANVRSGVELGDLAELTTLAGEIGLDEHLFQAALESGESAGPQNGALHKAMEFGVNSVPSVFIDGHLVQSVYDPKAPRPLLVKLEDEEN